MKIRTIFGFVLPVMLGTVAAIPMHEARAADNGETSGVLKLPESGARASPPDIKAPALGYETHEQLAASSATICLNAHVQNIGWQGWVCGASGDVIGVGTTGQSLRMEAVAIVTGSAGGVCAKAHVQNIGWQGWSCGGDGAIVVTGTTGRSLRMEALAIGTNASALCAEAHVQNVGWQGSACADPGYAAVVGTTGQSLRMEALAAVIY